MTSMGGWWLLYFASAASQNLQLLALARQCRFRDLQNQSLKSLKKMLHLVEYFSTVRLEDCHHYIELPTVSSVFTNGISVYFYSIGEEMSLLPTVKPWTCNVFEVGHAILYWQSILGLSIKDRPLEITPAKQRLYRRAASRLHRQGNNSNPSSEFPGIKFILEYFNYFASFFRSKVSFTACYHL